MIVLKRLKHILLEVLKENNKRNIANFRFLSRKSINMDQDYQNAIKVLNSLQSNAQYIQNAQNNQNLDNHKVRKEKKYLQRVGISGEILDTLSIIHVTGTKGKGSSCAFTEAILRHHGFSTGFYSSPHLVEVRERIRINGKAISKKDFAFYFWKIYQLFDEQKDEDNDVPMYFSFLTVMAFYVFLDKKVDVAILEVGIGGEKDCTNVVEKVPVVGINSIGIDHTVLLGDTIESIAWNKAGIMKEGCRAFTVPQPDNVMEVLKRRSEEKKCTLTTINYSSEYSIFPNEIVNLNANLAINLSKTWMEIRNRNLDPNIAKMALSNCAWPGRFHITDVKNIKFYLDGAHTAESLRLCVEWFKKNTEKSQRKKALMFNATGNRNVNTFFTELLSSKFDFVIFVPNRSHKTKNKISDNFNVNINQQIKKLEDYRKLWLQMEPTANVNVFLSIEEALEFFNSTQLYDVLVTGSLHLIGSVLTLIQPDLND